jgi:hypothetical protein
MGILKKYKNAIGVNSPLQGNINTGLIYDPSSPQQIPQDKVTDFDKTNLDLENPSPAGGPINASQYGHYQRYLPQPNRGYEDSPQGQIRGEGALQTSFNKTNLDLENPLVLGGPINEPFQTIIGSEVKFFNTTQPYTPKNTYKDSLQSEELRARASDPIR